MSTSNVHTAIREENEVPRHPADGNGVFKNAIPLLKTLSEAARENLASGLNSLQNKYAGSKLSNDLAALADVSSMTKNFSKKSRREIAAKNAIKSTCKGYSYGSLTTCVGIHLSNVPLKLNMLCRDCVVSTATGCVELPGPNYGQVINKDLQENLIGLHYRYKAGDVSLKYYLSSIKDILIVNKLCTAHRTLKKLNLTACPKGNIFKAQTARSQLYSNSFQQSKRFGGALDRVIASFLTMRPFFDVEILEPDVVSIEEFVSVACLICYLPTPFNTITKVLMHFYGQTADYPNFPIAFSPAALRQIRLAFAKDEAFPLDFNNYLKQLAEDNNGKNCFITCSPHAEHGCFVKAEILGDEEAGRILSRIYKLDIKEDSFVPNSFSVPEEEFVLEQEFPTLQVTIEKDKMELEAKLQKANARKLKVPKVAPVEKKAHGNKFYGYVEIAPFDSLAGKNPQRKAFVIGKPGKWDLKSNAVGVQPVLDFVGRSDLAANDAPTKKKRSHFIKGLILNAQKQPEYSVRNNELNAKNSESVFKTQNRFSGLGEVFSTLGGGKVPCDKVGIDHVTVTKGDKGMVHKVERKQVQRGVGEWRQVNVRADGDCFFWCLYFHGLPFDRQVWKGLFEANNIDISLIAKEEFDKGRFVCGHDWVMAIQKYLRAVNSKLKINLVFYSDLGKIMHYSCGRIDKSATINIIYNMDTQNHYDFIYNTSNWDLSLGETPFAKCEILGYHGMKNADSFHAAARDNVTFSMIKVELNETDADFVSDFKVTLRSRMVTFEFTKDSHDRNRAFAKRWNELRASSKDCNRLMRPAQITSAADDLAKTLKTSDSVCLGGRKERQRLEKLQRDNFERPCQGEAKVVESGSGPDGVKDEISSEISEELEVEEITEEKKFQYTTEAHHYQPQQSRVLLTNIQSMINKVVCGSVYDRIMLDMIEGRPFDFENILVEDLCKFLILLKQGSFPGNGLTYGQVLDYIVPILDTELFFHSGIPNIMIKNTTMHNFEVMAMEYHGIQGFSFSDSDLTFDENIEPFDPEYEKMEECEPEIINGMSPAEIHPSQDPSSPAFNLPKDAPPHPPEQMLIYGKKFMKNSDEYYYRSFKNAGELAVAIERRIEAEAVAAGGLPPVSGPIPPSSGGSGPYGPPKPPRGPGRWIDTRTAPTPWLEWQKSRHSSACDYINALTTTIGRFFEKVNLLGDIFSSVLSLFDTECTDKFRIHTLSNHAVAAEIRTLFTNIARRRDSRSLRDLLTTIKRNPLVCTMDISHFDLMSSEDYQNWVKGYIDWLDSPAMALTAAPTTGSPQEDAHVNIISVLRSILPAASSKPVSIAIIAFMNFCHKFIYPMLLERYDTKKFSLSALAEFLSAPHIRNALRTTRNHSDMQLKLQHFSNNFGSINYDCVADNFGEDLAGGTLYCSAVFLKHLSLFNMDLENAVCANWHDGYRKFKGGGGQSKTRRLGYGVYCGDLHANHIAFRLESADDIWRKETEDPHNLRTPLFVELPFSIGFHLPHMDNSSDNLALGCTNRVTRYQLEYPVAFFKFMRKHIDYRFDNYLLTPIEPGEVLTLEEYLALTSYTASEKETIRMAWEKFCNEMKLEINCNIFVKDESYDLFKAPRQIFSTTNMIKAIVSPLVRTLEKKWFAQIDYHVKGLTNKQRLEKLQRMSFCNNSEELLGMDFTSMESHQSFMTRKSQNYFAYRMFSNNLHLMNLLDVFFGSCDTREGYTKEKRHIVSILGKMASGASETAAYNLQFNEMVQDCCDYAYYCYNYHKLACAWNGLPEDEIGAQQRWWAMDLFDEWASISNKMDIGKSSKLLLEGDDSIKVANLGFADFAPIFFNQMCMEVKIEKFESLNSASFCGIIASETGDLIRDAVKTIIKMGSTNTRYLWSRDEKLASLMKLKAQCMLHDYYNCPILAAYCQRVIKDVDAQFPVKDMIEARKQVINMLRSEMSSWEWERFEYQLVSSVNETFIGMHTRLQYHKSFGITPEEQIFIESMLRVNSWEEVRMAFSIHIPYEAKLYTSRYVLEQPFSRGCVGEVFVPESLRFILDRESHYEVYRRFIATNHDRSAEKCTILF